MRKDAKQRLPLFAQGHLTEWALRALKSGALAGEPLDAALAHLGSCERCAGAFAQTFGEAELISAPPEFEAEIRRKTEEKPKKNGFALYVCRVVLAASVALILTFSGAFEALFAWQEKSGGVKPPDFRAVDRIGADLRDFSQTILNLEAFGYAAKEK